MNLYLYKQVRCRTPVEYARSLCVDIPDMAGRRILLVGGGECRGFGTMSKSEFVNVDLDPCTNGAQHNVTEIAADFTMSDVAPDRFDEIWALWSLPAYAQNDAAIKLFFLNAAIACKPGGKIRIAPLVSLQLEHIRELMESNYTGIRFGTTIESIKLLHQAGFESEYILTVQPTNYAERSVAKIATTTRILSAEASERGELVMSTRRELESITFSALSNKNNWFLARERHKVLRDKCLTPVGFCSDPRDLKYGMRKLSTHRMIIR